MKKIKSLILILAIATGISVFANPAMNYTPINTNVIQSHQTQNTNTTKTYISISPLDLVARPNFYFNKNVKIRAKFDKFATLGLDYKPAFRSSEKYISFLIQRPDVTDHNIPLSELKIFLNRTEAEKHIDLNSGDIVEFQGRVFSTALGDPWMDVDKFIVISTKPKDETK